MNLNLRAAVFCVVAVGSLLNGGCAATSAADNQGQLLVAPLLPDYKMEIALAKLNEIISNAKLTQQQLARFHYDRGVIYDRLGLRIMARIEFHEALKLQPDLADAYNFIGIYYTQEGEFDAAYEAFDSALELAPDYDYAYLNRGLALYYGDRPQLAVDDMQSFLNKEPSDGYRVLWLYLAEYQLEPKQALLTMQHNRSKLNDDTWSTVLVDYVLGKTSEAQVFALAKQGLKGPAEYAERLCEAYFYLAKIAEEQQQNDKAANYLRLALATNIYDFVEHRYARVELALLANTMDNSKDSSL
ncbi:MAG: lipoprotein NlpI [Shewanella sp.]|uniref:lipoprotein NlpI n=1 Tax=Shewanella TaxID=22 RepID=UPI0016736067|nr:MULTISPECIES: lipoprotein NlpI [Shewanella]MBO1271524.1 lipoprotein NlpI [Shewanella sp. 4t3-1-2LB]MCL2905737.1 lipoprotein NlpI [Shewanella fodinae]MDN5370471.1 lipoprotein NlpI [Shewanella sp.]GGY97316.1 lipoprotein NlpI [Shewanella fodinae]